MIKYINFIKTIGEMFLILLIYNIINTILYYFNILNTNTIGIINYIFILLLFFFSGLKIGKRNETKGYLNGFFIGLLIIIIFILFSLINSAFKVKSLIYFTSLIISSIIGGILGVDKKQKN